MNGTIAIGGRVIGKGQPACIVAEMSGNHGGSKGRAMEIIARMKEAGADAVKFQTYTPDTITIDCNNPFFTDCLRGTVWEGRTLHDLYAEASMPWEWQPELKAYAESLGMQCFSTAFDATSVDFLERMNVPAYKIASFELVHLPLIRRIAATGKPLILSTGMATREEIAEAIAAAREAGATEIALLKCTSAYPARIEDANLRTIPAMAEEFRLPVGVSDHSLGNAVPVAAVTLGACIVEKHFTLDRKRDAGPDSSFSLEPLEYRVMVDAVRAAERDPPSAPIEEQALGYVRYGPTESDRKSLVFRPSLFVVEDVEAGETFTERNVRIIRPGYGLPPMNLERILGRKARNAVTRGTPLSEELLEAR
ncbi:MAG: pseudaminic acid synthase [Candidatus Peribacteraceae bacterium]|jgi:N-acetylneuraminate synthase